VSVHDLLIDTTQRARKKSWHIIRNAHIGFQGLT
jgi:hypothetical protein